VRRKAEKEARRAFRASPEGQHQHNVNVTQFAVKTALAVVLAVLLLVSGFGPFSLVAFGLPFVKNNKRV
jgi:hypothetical protein